jgi:collagenase-like PrtC family protease
MEFVLVPKEPTPEMIEASWQATANNTREEYMMAQLGSTRAVHARKVKQRWAAMIAAAPIQPLT